MWNTIQNKKKSRVIWKLISKEFILKNAGIFEYFLNFSPLLCKWPSNQPAWFCKQIQLQWTQTSQDYALDDVFQSVLAPMPKTDLPAQHISQTLLLYYNPSKDLRKIKVETVLEEMRQGKGQVFCIIRSLYLTITIRININKIPFLPLWKTHSS